MINAAVIPGIRIVPAFLPNVRGMTRQLAHGLIAPSFFSVLWQCWILHNLLMLLLPLLLQMRVRQCVGMPVIHGSDMATCIDDGWSFRCRDAVVVVLRNCPPPHRLLFRQG
jgi:hypothetical protein